MPTSLITWSFPTHYLLPVSRCTGAQGRSSVLRLPLWPTQRENCRQQRRGRSRTECTRARSVGRTSRRRAAWSSTSTSTAASNRSAATSAAKPTPSFRTCAATNACTPTVASRSAAPSAPGRSPTSSPWTNIADSAPLGPTSPRGRSAVELPQPRTEQRPWTSPRLWWSPGIGSSSRQVSVPLPGRLCHPRSTRHRRFSGLHFQPPELQLESRQARWIACTCSCWRLPRRGRAARTRRGAADFSCPATTTTTTIGHPLPVWKRKRKIAAATRDHVIKKRDRKRGRSKTARVASVARRRPTTKKTTTMFSLAPHPTWIILHRASTARPVQPAMTVTHQRRTR